MQAHSKNKHTINCRGIAFALCIAVGSANASVVSDATALANQGRFDEAATQLQSYVASDAVGADRLTALWALADVYRAQGKNRAALGALLDAQQVAVTAAEQTATQLRYGGVLLALGEYPDASLALEKAADAKTDLSANEQAALELDLGNVAVQLNQLRIAATHFENAEQIARRNANFELAARAQLNRARLQIEDRDLAGLEENLADAAKTIEQVDRAVRARMFVSLGELYQRAVLELSGPATWRGNAHEALQKGLSSTDNPATRAYANGFLGALYEDAGRTDEAISYTRKALFLAQQERADEQTYRWEWQLGRLLRADGKLADAQAAFNRAVTILNEVKSNLVLGSRGVFERRVAPVYTGYADLMLQRSGSMATGEAKQTTLREVRDLLEDLKLAEVEDYFASECVVRNQSKSSAQISDGTAAVLYPVLLDDRLELLVETGTEISQFTTDVGRNQITQAIRRFRIALERSTSGDAYLAQAQNLYGWIIKPAAALLKAKQIETLVVVPEGALRTIPLAALHDGDNFLVADYAVVMTPAIQLTEQLTQPKEEQLLVGGVSESVQGFVGLPSVNREIDTISSMYPGRTIKNQAFQLQTVTDELQAGQYSVAHFATHGEFSSDHSRSFILTYDDKLTMEALQSALQARSADNPLDLLVLSACKTAAGDDRAALGLAGVAVQSGAQSALASLWYISDTATAELIDQFYQGLNEPDTSKAKSLQQAQLALLENDRFDHPSYWAPYLLIGNWL